MRAAPFRTLPILIAAATPICSMPALATQDTGPRVLRGALRCTDFNQVQIEYRVTGQGTDNNTITLQGRPNGPRTRPFDATLWLDRLDEMTVTIAGGSASNPYDGTIGFALSADGRRIEVRAVGGQTRCAGSVALVSGPPMGVGPPVVAAIAAPPPGGPAKAAPVPVPPPPAPAPQARVAPPKPRAPEVQKSEVQKSEPPRNDQASAPPAPAVAAAAVDPIALDLAFWESIKTSRDPQAYRAYLESFPEGRFAPLARLRARDAQVAKAPPAGAPAELALDYGRFHALVIGNNAYGALPRLETAVNDARTVAAVLREDYDFAVTVLEDATRADIMRALATLRQSLTGRDNLLIYYAGHGHIDKAIELGYWLPVDAEKGDPTNWIANTDLSAAIRGIAAKHVLVVSDSCYAGTLLRSVVVPPARGAAERVEWLKRMIDKRARVVLSSGGVEPVVDGGGGGHSVFGKAFLDALKENDAVIDGQGLFDRIKRPVTLNSPQTPEYADMRQAGHDGGDFLFVRRR